MKRSTRALAVLVLSGLLAGCGGTMYPITSGSHRAGPIPGGRYVVWSNHAAASQAITSFLLQLGQTVVERSRLDQVFAEQHLRLTHTPDSEADVLRVGKLVGATQVIFVEVQGAEPPQRSYMFTISTPPTVMVRSVDVQTGTVLWSGSALYPEVPSNMNRAVGTLAHWGMWRAMCRTEAGDIWEEPDARQGGCKAGSSHAQAASGAKTDREIWGEMRRMETRNKP